jgi:hypothetical protein
MLRCGSSNRQPIDAQSRTIGRWLGELPDEEVRFRERIWNLKNQLGNELFQVLLEYDRLYESGASIPEVSEEIEKAGREMREWLAAGLGEESRQEWIRRVEAAAPAGGQGHELDRRYGSARRQAITVFARVDLALARAVDRLLGEMADALRRKLTEAVVPAGTDNYAILSEFWTRHRTPVQRHWPRRRGSCLTCVTTAAAYSSGLADR